MSSVIESIGAVAIVVTAVAALIGVVYLITIHVDTHDKVLRIEQMLLEEDEDAKKE